MNHMNCKNNAEARNTNVDEAVLAALHVAHKMASPTSTAPEDLKWQRLGQEAGVPAVLQNWPEMRHVFRRFSLKTAEDAMEPMAQFLETLR